MATTVRQFSTVQIIKESSRLREELDILEFAFAHASSSLSNAHLSDLAQHIRTLQARIDLLNTLIAKSA